MLVGLFSCQKENTPEPRLSDYRFTTEWNNSGVEWRGIPEIRLDNVTDTLTILGIANRPNDEVIGMKIKFQGVGTYTLTRNQAYYYSTVGGDVLTSEYKLVPDATSQLIITAYDAEKKLVEGTFNLSLQKKWSSNVNFAEELQLTNGKFKGKVKD